MSRRAKVFSIAALVLLLITCSLLATRINVVQGPSSLQNTKTLLSSGIKLDTATEQPKISRFTAVKNAWTAFGRQGVNRLAIEYQLVSINGTNVNKQPTYIVSFKENPAWLLPSAGRGGGISSSHTEFNVLVDATSGKVMQSFEYR